MKSPAPAYYRVKLDPQQEIAARHSMQHQGFSELHIDVEIIEISQGMRALTWVWVQGGNQAGVLRQCQLSPAQWAECSLMLRSGQRPVYRVSWELLGQISDGLWGASSGRVSALHSLPASSWGELEQLTGVSNLS